MSRTWEKENPQHQQKVESNVAITLDAKTFLWHKGQALAELESLLASKEFNGDRDLLEKAFQKTNSLTQKENAKDICTILETSFEGPAIEKSIQSLRKIDNVAIVQGSFDFLRSAFNFSMTAANHLKDLERKAGAQSNLGDEAIEQIKSYDTQLKVQGVYDHVTQKGGFCPYVFSHYLNTLERKLQNKHKDLLSKEDSKLFDEICAGLRQAAIIAKPLDNAIAPRPKANPQLSSTLQDGLYGPLHQDLGLSDIEEESDHEQSPWEIIAALKKQLSDLKGENQSLQETLEFQLNESSIYESQLNESMAREELLRASIIESTAKEREMILIAELALSQITPGSSPEIESWTISNQQSQKILSGK